MTAGLQDPYEMFWAQARDTSLNLTPEENSVAEKIRRTGTNAELAGVALALATAFLLYRRHMARRLREELGPDTSYSLMQVVIGTVWRAFLPKWVAVVTPAIVSGYRQGIREARTGEIPGDYLYSMAEQYAEQMGGHIHDVTADALLRGYQGQINRKVARDQALRNVLDAVGVPPRAMNSLVTMWSSDDPKNYTMLPGATSKEARTRQTAAAELVRRSKMIGENEAWATKNMAKQLSWMYAQEDGVIPQSATRSWLTKKDERVCPYCGPMHKREVPLKEKFITDNGNVWAPPLHPNCRCEIVLNMNIGRLVSKAKWEEKEHPRSKDGRFKDKTDFTDPTIGNLFKEAELKYAQPEKLVDKPKLTEQPKLTDRVKLTDKPKKAFKLGDGKLIPTKLSSAKLQNAKLKAKQIVLGDRIEPPVKLTEKDFSAPTEEWQNLDYPIYAVVSREDFSGDVYDANAMVQWRAYPDHSDPHSVTEFVELINSTWQEAAERAFLHYEDSGEWSTYIDDEGKQWFVDTSAFDQTMVDAINNYPHGEHQVTLVNEDDEEDLKVVTTGEIDSYLGLSNWLYDYAPVVIVTNKGKPGITDIHPSRSGMSSAPGSYRVVRQSDERFGKTHLMYDHYVVEPTDLYPEDVD